MIKVRNRIGLSFAALLLLLLLACVPSFAKDDPQVVKEGVDFESDIMYKKHFSAPKVKVTGTDNYDVFRDYDRLYTRYATAVTIPKDSSDTVEVDYGVVGTVNGKNVVLKLTFSRMVHWPYMNKQSDRMQIYIGDNPTTGFVLDNIYLCEVKYDIRYEDGHLLDDPCLTLDSLNGDQREGAKPINASKMSLDEGTIMRESGLLEPYTIDGVSASSILDNLKDIGTTKGWWYDDGKLAPGEKYTDAGADYIFNPLTGKKDKYNPRTAITCFYEDSSDMRAWITARNAGVWESALVVAKEPEHNLTIKKETNVPSDDEFTFRLKIYRDIEMEETTIVDEEEPAGEAYAVFDSSDNTLTFFRDEAGKHSDGEEIGTKTYYAGFENSSSAPSWNSKASQVKRVVFDDVIVPTYTISWFKDMTGLTSLTSEDKIENLRMHKVIRSNQMFQNCRDLTSLDTSGFYMPVCSKYGNMFDGCSNLTELDLSGLDFREFAVLVNNSSSGDIPGFGNMFKNCRKLSTTIHLPVTTMIYGDTFLNAATVAGAKITVEYYIARSNSHNVVNPRGLPTIETILSSANGNVKAKKIDEIYYAPVPDYIGKDHVVNKTERHIFDLTKDESFEYKLDTQTYTFKVKAGKSITIPNIPKSYHYEVEEVGAPDRWIFVSSTDNTIGTMDKDEKVVFKSKIETKSLTIRKKTTGNVAGKFEFKIRAWKDDNELDLSSGLGQPDGDGYYHFTLSNAGEKKIPEIPVGYQYEIIEESKAGWELIEKTNDKGTIEGDVTAEFTNRFTNTKTTEPEKPTNTPKVKVSQKVKKAKKPNDESLSDLKIKALKNAKHPNTRPLSAKNYNKTETGDDFSVVASAWIMVICSILLACCLIVRRRKGRY